MIVVGSINVDHVVHCPALPRPGETTLAQGDEYGFGGKGANQAAAAAAFGAPTVLIGAVGMDAAGTEALVDLDERGVDTGHVHHRDGSRTGIAIVLVDAAGENSIVVLPGANAELDGARVDAALEDLQLSPADVVLASAEVPGSAIVTAHRACVRVGALFVYNVAPVRSLPRRIGRGRTVLVVNEGEAFTLTGTGDVATAAARLARNGCEVVVTRGAHGSSVHTGGQLLDTPALPVDVVDSTGAGDAFCGALAAELARGSDLGAAVVLATAAGGIAVTASGARGALATRADVT